VQNDHDLPLAPSSQPILLWLVGSFVQSLVTSSSFTSQMGALLQHAVEHCADFLFVDDFFEHSTRSTSKG
jgi:hypothetical protein